MNLKIQYISSRTLRPEGATLRHTYGRSTPELFRKVAGRKVG